ncbi:TIGR02301 family protein [Rhizobium sp. KAs_5_22]|nr:TIGR02301 family protein [Ciceribacter selenitireducens]PPJ47134.1 TIGR02301 family protein [Rhizobium sp. KAs_5_22]
MRARGFSAKALFVAAALAIGALPANAQAPQAPAAPEATPESTEKPAPYDDKLARLSEIIGAVHYLRNLCDKEGEPEWREAMQELVDAETGTEPKRRARMVSAYNRGYRSFASVYTTCTASAIAAEGFYRNEGATLAVEIAARYGN